MLQFRSDTRPLCISSYYFENFIGKSVNWMRSHKISRTVTKLKFKFSFFVFFCDNFIRSYISQQNRAEIHVCFYRRIKQYCYIFAICRSFPGGHLVPKMPSYRHRCDVGYSRRIHVITTSFLRHVPAGLFFNFRQIWTRRGSYVTSQFAMVLYHLRRQLSYLFGCKTGLPLPRMTTKR